MRRPLRIVAFSLAVPAAVAFAADEAPRAGLPPDRLVLFDFDSYAVKPDYAAMLQAHGGFLGARPALRVVVQGSTDERGSREYNLALGQRRAQAVKRRLVASGARETQIEAVSFGEERPRDAGYDDAARQQNRSAAIAYPGEH